MLSNFLKFPCTAEHVLNNTPNALLDNDYGSDLNSEQKSLWKLIPNSKDSFPIHKMLNPSSNHTKGYNMEKIRFNKNNIENLETKEKRYKAYSDEVRGLYVEVLTSGRKAFRVKYLANYKSYAVAINIEANIMPL